MEDILTLIGGGVVGVFAMIFAVMLMGMLMMFFATIMMFFVEMLMLFIELIFVQFMIIDFLAVLLVSFVIPETRSGARKAAVFAGTFLLSGGLVASVLMYLNQEPFISLVSAALIGALLGLINPVTNFFEYDQFVNRLKGRFNPLPSRLSWAAGAIAFGCPA